MSETPTRLLAFAKMQSPPGTLVEGIWVHDSGKDFSVISVTYRYPSLKQTTQIGPFRVGFKWDAP